MCYPSGTNGEGAYNSASRRLLVRAVAAAMEVAAREQQSVNTGSGLAGGGGITKACVCSPTGHPGSFRCRHHHGEYQWVNNRLASKTS